MNEREKKEYFQILKRIAEALEYLAANKATEEYKKQQ